MKPVIDQLPELRLPCCFNSDMKVDRSESIQMPVIMNRAESLSAGIHADERTGGWSDSTQKRALDFVYAAILFLASMPIMAVIAALVKLSSPGPVFFRQKRVG